MKLILPKPSNIEPSTYLDPVFSFGGYYRKYSGIPMRARLTMALEAIGDTRPTRVLEVGYGSGIFIPALCNTLSKDGEYCGIDVHDKHERVQRMVERENVPNPVQLKFGSAMDIPFEPESFDLVVSLSVLEHIDPENLKSVMEEISRVLTVGGAVIVGIPLHHPAIRLLSVVNNWDYRSEHPSGQNEVVPLFFSNFDTPQMRTYPLGVSPFGIMSALSVYILLCGHARK